MKYDVAIIGGGPAGATAATQLAKAGLHCILFEKEIFPRPHVGESLLPFCYDLLQELGVLAEVQNTSFIKPGVRFVNADASLYSNYCFGNRIDGPSANALHVNRAKFDKILLDNAKDAGCQVHEGTKVKSISIEKDFVEVAVDRESNEYKIECSFLLDASGQGSFLTSRMKQKQKIENLDRTAFWGHWKGIRLTPELEEGIQQIVYIGGEQIGWIWCIPLPDDILSIGCVLDNTYVKKRKADFTTAETWQKAFYLSEIVKPPYVRKLIEGATLDSRVEVIGNYSYKSATKFGSRYAMIGDAAAFIDPIFSTGVFLAMKSAILISNTLIRNLKSDRIEQELDKTYSSINGAYRLIERLIQQYYNPTSINFYEINDHYQKTDSAIGLMHHLLAGDIFERYDVYDDFLSKLENEKTFKRYKNLIYKREELDKASCKHLAQT